MKGVCKVQCKHCLHEWLCSNLRLAKRTRSQEEQDMAQPWVVLSEEEEEEEEEEVEDEKGSSSGGNFSGKK